MNGIGLMSALQAGQPRVQLQTDASGSWGISAVLVSATPWQGFAARWTPVWQSCSIAPKEMYPVLAAACYAGSTRDGALLRLLWALMMLSAQFNCSIRAEHLPGAQNLVTDALSRGEPTRGVLQGRRLELVELPGRIVATLDELATADPDWGSPSWKSLVGVT